MVGRSNNKLAVGEVLRFPDLGDPIYATLRKKVARFYEAAGQDPDGPRDISLNAFVEKTYQHVDTDSANKLTLSEIRVWCQAQFGDDWLWSHNRFYFINEADATMFRLRWK